MNLLIVAVIGLLIVAAAAAFAPRIRVAEALILVLVGIGVSFLPFVPAIEIDPEWILAGLLPPLLYSASVSMPTMNFRREFSAIGSLSVVLVVVSAVLLGLFFAWAIPGVGLWWGIALGAIVSPTDAVATSIVKRVGVSGRVVSVLEGESLLNDATALVLLRTAVAGTAASVSLWGALGKFAYAVAIAAVFGLIVGHLNLWIRSKLTDSTVNTVISFTVPFVASIPAELLGASGLVAAVIAGLVTGHGAARRLSPQHRLSDNQNWHVIELVLEGAIFLVMGLELAGVVADVQSEYAGVGLVIGIAAGALVLTVLIRAAYVAPLIVAIRRRARRREKMKPRLDLMQEHLSGPDDETIARLAERDPRRRGLTPGRIQQFRTRVRRLRADVDYLLSAPLGWREGGILVWAGMRGAITLAAAQTLPDDAPQRQLLILIAFAVAAGSLLIQGSTLSTVVSWLKPHGPDYEAMAEDRSRILTVLADVENRTRQTGPDDGRDDVPESGQAPAASKQENLAVITAQRAALLDARDDGAFDAETLDGALANLDAEQISIEMKGGPPV